MAGQYLGFGFRLDERHQQRQHDRDETVRHRRRIDVGARSGTTPAAPLPNTSKPPAGHQTDPKTFEVGARFRFRNTTVENRVVRHLGKVGAFNDDEQRRTAFLAAASYRPADGSTDLASIPQFMRWLVNTYGVHTLAAIIHDKLITEEPNKGDLHSDVVSDRFFREMLQACGMPSLLRWIVWTAVALRTRWAAGTFTRAKVLLWAVSCVVGIGGTIAIAASGHWLLAIAFGAACLVVAAGLWGRQWGAAVVAAIALPFIVPVAVLVLVAQAVFWGFDRLKR